MNVFNRHFSAKHLSQYVMVALLLLLAPNSIFAATYYVATDGKDTNSGSDLLPFQTIKRGLSAVSAGDTLYIRGGIYREGINSNSQTIPTGSSWTNAPVISGYSGEMVVLQPVGGAEVVNLANPAIQYVVFNNLVLDAASLQRSCAAGYGCSTGVSGYGGAHHVRFTNVEIKNAAGAGVLITRGSSDGVSSFEFIGCNIHHNGIEARDHGLYLTTSNNKVKNSKIHHNTGHGIHLYTGNPSITIDNNVIDGNEIYSNALLSGSAPGILVDYGSGNLVMNNIVTANKNGIQVGNPFSATTTASNSKIYNNTVYNNMPGLGIDVFVSSSQADIKNNIVYKNGGTIGNKGSGTITSNNLVTDPKFVDEPNGNFKLQATSPAVNQGVIIAQVPFDIEGTTRPQLGTHDVGAYEYGSGTTDTVPPSQPVIRSVSTP